MADLDEDVSGDDLATEISADDDVGDDQNTDEPADEGEEEPKEGEDDEGEESEEAEPPAGRAASRVAKLANERKAEREARVAAEAKVTMLEQQMAQVVAGQRQTQTAEQQRAEAERLANMDPLERVAHEGNQRIAAMQHEVARIQHQFIDTQDRNTFLQKAAAKPLYAKYEAKVEAALQGMRSKGLNSPREDILAYLVGKAALEGAGKSGAAKQKTAASDRVAAAKAKTVNGRSDASGSRKGKSLEDRLSDVQL